MGLLLSHLFMGTYSSALPHSSVPLFRSLHPWVLSPLNTGVFLWQSSVANFYTHKLSTEHSTDMLSLSIDYSRSCEPSEEVTWLLFTLKWLLTPGGFWRCFYKYSNLRYLVPSNFLSSVPAYLPVFSWGNSAFLPLLWFWIFKKNS